MFLFGAVQYLSPFFAVLNLLYGPLGLGTEEHLWSQFQIDLNEEFSGFPGH